MRLREEIQKVLHEPRVKREGVRGRASLIRARAYIFSTTLIPNNSSPF
jgi:hypothetical protein